MKRFLIIAAMLLATANFMAQEVHGIESRMVCTYDCNPNGSWDWWGGGKKPWFSYQFTNQNSIPVTVEIELYKYSFSTHEFVLSKTKSIVLQSHESYVWKGENEKGVAPYSGFNLAMEGHEGHYVKYKAYKLL